MSSFHGLVEVLQPIAVPVDVEDMSLMEEPIKDRRRGQTARRSEPRDPDFRRGRRRQWMVMNMNALQQVDVPVESTL